MKTLITAALLALGLLAGSAFATSADCEAKATDKKLAGAARNSFMKKCEKDAGGDACSTAAADKKLVGAAKTSFMKKCAADAAAAK